MKILGLHHITALAADPARNLAFYTRVLGQRLVKKTVNYDDPETYHLYYADEAGTPGTVLTFFPLGDVPRGRPGIGQANAIAFSVPPGSLAFWRERLTAAGLSVRDAGSRFGEPALAFADPDGLPLELIASGETDPREGARHPDIPAQHALRGFHSVTLAVADPAPTAAVLTSVMGHRQHAAEGLRTRFTVGAGGPGTYVDLLSDPALPRGRPGAGIVHHVAFRTPDDAAELAALAELRDAGLAVSPQIDRNYFHSLYFPSPGGVLFEIATDPPGFTIDEPADRLGTSLKLPPRYEPRRAEIEAALPPL